MRLKKRYLLKIFFKYRGDRIIVLKNWRRSHHFIAFRASHHLRSGHHMKNNNFAFRASFLRGDRINFGGDRIIYFLK